MNLPFNWIGLVVVVGLAAGCGRKPADPGSGARGGFPVPQVVTVQAHHEPVAEKLSLVANLLANEAVEVKSEIDGTVQAIHFQEGQRVEKEQLLVELDARKLAASVEEAEANFKLSQANYERARQLVRDKLISQQEFEQLASTFQANQAALELKRQQLKDTKIVAAFAGIVGSRTIAPGQVISRNTNLTWVVDIDPVKLEMNVPERFIGALKVGQGIEISLAAYPGRKFKGEVYFIAQSVDPVTRTVLVKSKMPNPTLELKPGMFANLDLTLQTRERAVVIPEIAITRIIEGNRAMIYVVDSSNNAQLRPVELGVRMSGKVEVLKGLQADETVITEGVQKVIPGKPVAIAPTKEADVAKPAGN
jgi:membrane fusion protein, multidrug efflux system